MNSIEVKEKKPLFMPVFLCEFTRAINCKSIAYIKSLLEHIVCVAGNAKIRPSGLSGFEITNIDHKNLSHVNIGNGWWASKLTGYIIHYYMRITLFDLYGLSQNFDEFVLVKYEDYEEIKHFCNKSYEYRIDNDKYIAFDEYCFGIRLD
jgi:hypothetical protein